MNVPLENYLRSRVLQLRTSSPNLSGIVKVLLSGSSTNSRILPTLDLLLIGDLVIFLELQLSEMLQMESSIHMLRLDPSLHLVHSSVMVLRLRKRRLITTHHLLLHSPQVETMVLLPILLPHPLIMVVSQELSRMVNLTMVR